MWPAELKLADQTSRHTGTSLTHGGGHPLPRKTSPLVAGPDLLTSWLCRPLRPGGDAPARRLGDHHADDDAEDAERRSCRTRSSGCGAAPRGTPPAFHGPFAVSLTCPSGCCCRCRPNVSASAWSLSFLSSSRTHHTRKTHIVAKPMRGEHPVRRVDAVRERPQRGAVTEREEVGALLIGLVDTVRTRRRRAGCIPVRSPILRLARFASLTSLGCSPGDVGDPRETPSLRGIRRRRPSARC